MWKFRDEATSAMEIKSKSHDEVYQSKPFMSAFLLWSRDECVILSDLFQDGLEISEKYWVAGNTDLWKATKYCDELHGFEFCWILMLLCELYFCDS